MYRPKHSYVFFIMYNLCAWTFDLYGNVCLLVYLCQRTYGQRICISIRCVTARSTEHINITLSNGLATLQHYEQHYQQQQHN